MSNRVDSTSRPHTPPVTVVSGEFSDFDEPAEAVSGWGLDWVQLDRGPLRSRIRQVVGPSVMLSRFKFNRKFHQRGQSPPGVLTFGLNGRGSPVPEWRRGAGGDNAVIVFPKGDEFDAVSQAGFFGDTMSLPEERIRQVAHHLGAPDPLKPLSGGMDLVDMAPELIESIRGRLDAMHSEAEGPPSGHRNLSVWSTSESELVATLVAGLSAGRSPEAAVSGPVLRRRAMQKALEFIDAHADDAPTVEMICAAANASWRTLNYAFRERFDLTPKQYLHRVRLQRVRQDLVRSAGAAPISEIAAHRGFWHMGAFAADYRRQFGELPSETIRGS